MQRKTERLRHLIERPGVLLLPGVYDGLSLHLVERYGFEGAFISGAGISESLIGKPDIGLMNVEENLFVSRRLAGASAIPLLADADTGYGNAVNVFHTVRAFEQAGVAGIMIEDQAWPKRCGHMSGKTVIPMGEMVGKVRAAVEARSDRAFVVMARTDAAGVNGLDDAITRLNTYFRAGADVLFADALTSVEDIQTVIAGVDGPVCVNMGFGIRARATTPMISPKQLAGYGAAMALYPRLLTSTAVRGMERGIEALQQQISDGATVNRPDLAAAFEELNELSGLTELRALERRFVDSPGDGVA